MRINQMLGQPFISSSMWDGKPDNARGGGKDASKLDEALAKAKTLLG